MPRQGIIIAQRYRLDNEVATGATGRVWLATDMLLRQPVAVKVLRPEYARDPALLRRFREAAGQAAAISHRSVAKVLHYGAGGPGDPPYVVMELIEGRALPEVIGGETVRASFIAKALAQVAEGLHAAHRAGLVHGDLKPANILLWSQAGRRATVTDFGITHALGAIGWAGNTLGTGTVLYLAPELVSGGPGTPASDLYSLGIIAYEWLTGVPPFTGTSQQVMAAHLRRPLPRLPGAVPPGLAELVARLTANDPAARFQDASEAAAAARALAWELREDAQDSAASFPVAPEERGLPVGREEAAIAVPPPAGQAAGEPTGLRRLELAAYKREIAWVAGAMVLAGVISWAPSGPIQSAVKIVQLAVPAAAAHQATPAGHPAVGREHPGSGDGYPAGGDDAGPGGDSASPTGAPAGQRLGLAASGLGGRPGWADGGPASATASPVAGSGSPRPSATAPSSPPGSPAPCPCRPTGPLSTPTSHPAPGPGPLPPSAPASSPAPLPSTPLPIPTISLSVPPISVPPLPPIPLPLPPVTLSVGQAVSAPAVLISAPGDAISRTPLCDICPNFLNRNRCTYSRFLGIKG